MKKLLTIACLCAATAVFAYEFKVETIGGATVAQEDDTYTFAAPDAYHTVKVYENGVLQSGTEYTEPAPLTKDTYVIGVAETNWVMCAESKKWWNNPKQTAFSACSWLSHQDEGRGYNASLDAGYYAFTFGMASDLSGNAGGEVLCDFEKLLSASPIYSADATTCNEWGDRGAVVNAKLGIVLYGSCGTAKFRAVTMAEDHTAYEITTDVAGLIFGAMGFSSDNQYLYTDEYAGGDNKCISKFQVLDGLRGNGQKLTRVARYKVGTRIRTMKIAHINNKDLAYCLLDGTAGVAAVDFSNYAEDASGNVISGVTQILGSTPVTANYGGVSLSGENTSTPHLFVTCSNDSYSDASLVVLELAADGLSGDVVAEFNRAELEAAAGFTFNRPYETLVTTSPDESYAYYHQTSGISKFEFAPLDPIQCGNEIGMLEITSDKTEIVLSVPFSELATAENVCVSNIVKTAGLEENDKLYCYFPSTKKWEAWTLVAESGVKHWQSVGKAAIDPATGKPSTEKVTASTDSTTVVPGGALWLSRQHADNKIYVYGAVVSGSISTSVSAGVRTLIANPNAASCNLESKYTPTAGDQFLDSTGTRWTYSSNKGTGKWSRREGATSIVSQSSITLAQGEGGWLIPKADVTINW